DRIGMRADRVLVSRAHYALEHFDSAVDRARSSDRVSDWPRARAAYRCRDVPPDLHEFRRIPRVIRSRSDADGFWGHECGRVSDADRDFDHRHPDVVDVLPATAPGTSLEACWPPRRCSF